MSKHGTTTGYHRHKAAGEPPCDPCRWEYNRDARRRRKERQLNRVKLVAPGRAVSRIGRLKRNGWTTGAIAAASGVSRRTILDVGNRPLIYKTTYDRIMSVQPEDRRGLVGRRVVPGYNAARRIQGLRRKGWSVASISSFTGIGRDRLGRVMHGKDETISATSDVMIRKFFAWAERRDPLDHGVSPLTKKRTIERAVRDGAIPLAAWDNIDSSIERPKGVA